MKMCTSPKVTRVVTWIWLIAFIFTQTLPSYAQTEKRASYNTTTHSPAAHFALPQEPADLKLSSQLGVIQEIQKSNSTENQKTIFLIQDAHAVPEAQKAIGALLHELYQKTGTQLVGLEGTQGRLDLTLLQQNPEPELMDEAIASYLDTGELSGAVASAIRHPELSVYGIEDWALYEKAIDSFLMSLRQQTDFLSQIRV
jgi:hypothetical protein